jgi:transposase InsO family protein
MWRVTNAYSKSLRHLKAAIALLIAWYNFVRVHQSLRVTPAMQAGLTDHVWSIPELLSVA